MIGTKLILEREQRQVLFTYFLLQMAFIFCQLILVSIVAFFHFLLDHKISVIEEWLGHNGWEITLMAKVIPLAIFSRVLAIKPEGDISIIKTLKKHIFSVDRKVAVLSIYLLSISFAIYQNQVGSIGGLNFSFNSKQVSSYIGLSLYFFLDFYFLYLLRAVHRQRASRTYSLRLSLCLSLVFTISSLAASPYKGIDGGMYFIYFLTLALSSGLSGHYFGNALFLVIFFVAPHAVSFGQDLIWSSSVQLFSMLKGPHLMTFFMCWLFGLVYLLRNRRKFDLNHSD